MIFLWKETDELPEYKEIFMGHYTTGTMTGCMLCIIIYLLYMELGGRTSV
ncbi:hypothetical protein BRYFOR_08237 [Marvinbryantia formatexigens DSM 14469]|uniref:Uncharacterized protein n=1 Tax=Marvinbryantia formatexigens DSM 14469 TaxID=478749 RepID=C6LHX3_9FIRM|nr:hypothetical protein BRYFOR_08237 [Marvinbryantia formatexigens DSM 14469]